VARAISGNFIALYSKRRSLCAGDWKPYMEVFCNFNPHMYPVWFVPRTNHTNQKSQTPQSDLKGFDAQLSASRECTTNFSFPWLVKKPSAASSSLRSSIIFDSLVQAVVLRVKLSFYSLLVNSILSFSTLHSSASYSSSNTKPVRGRATSPSAPVPLCHCCCSYKPTSWPTPWPYGSC